VSVSLDLQVNSVAIPRFAKQDIGAITKLINNDGRAMTVNVEYNQLDSLLRSTVAPQGDVNDPHTGHSPYPGNINQLLFRMSEYVATLNITHGVMGEFVNPKYADAEKSLFKKPTRLECMMQDYPKALSSSANVGFTIFPTWFTYSPVKNNTKDAPSYIQRGVPPACALSGECDQYNIFRELLVRNGCNVEPGQRQSFREVDGILGPQIVFDPTFCIFPADFKTHFPYPTQIHISARSTLVIKGNAIIEKLNLDGALHINVPDGMCIRINMDGVLSNCGYNVVGIDENDTQYSEETIMRGYKITKTEEFLIGY
jgi:UDP-sugar pyrophosphorylase